MRKTIFTALSIACALSLGARTVLDPGDERFLPQAESLTTPNGLKNFRATGNVANVIITLEDGFTAESLDVPGLEVESAFGTFVVASLPVTSIDALCELDGVKRVSVSRPARLLNNLGRQECNVDAVQKGLSDLPSAYNGAGVVVGLFDGGLDPNHINFKKADDITESRVKRVWTYTAYTGGRVTERAYSTPTQIAGFKTDDKDETHGTHVLGTAAGSYVNGTTSYHGVAPEADIAIACGSTTEASILKGVERIITYAEENNQPAVVNLSLGINIGAHDGSDSFTAALDALAERAVITLAAGNEGDRVVGVSGTFNSADHEIKTFVVPSENLKMINQYYGARYQTYGSAVDVWSEDDTPIEVSLALYNKTTGMVTYEMPLTTAGQYVASGTARKSGDLSNTQFTSAYTNSRMGGYLVLNPTNNRYMASISMDLQNKSVSTSILPAIIVKGTTGKRVDIYNDAYYIDFSSNDVAGYSGTIGENSINTWACGKNTISVGAFCVRNAVPYVGETLKDAVSFSSWGTLPDGRSLPHIMAPGSAIISSMSTPHVEESSSYDATYEPKKATATVDGKKYYWTVMGGTSMASPFMAGTAAVWLSANPSLSPADIRNIAVETANKSGRYEDIPKWGAGKVDVLAGTKMALNMSGLETIEKDGLSPLMVTTVGRGIFDIFLAGERNVTAYLYDMQGRVGAVTEGAGDNVTMDASHLSDGIYIIKVKGANNSFSQRVLIR